MDKLNNFIGNKIRHYRKMKKMTQEELGNLIGTKKATISNYETGYRSPNQDVLFDLAEALDVSINDLFPPTEAKNMIPVTGFERIPVLGKIACGDPITAIENISEYREVPKDYLDYHGELFFLEATGDSMEPKIPNGSYVLCRKQEDVESGEIAAVLVNGDEETTLKKVIKQGKTILLQPLNEDYAPYIVTEENPAKIVGKALRVDVEL
ncbi:LexA family protein [Marinilactibacillus piezotolerans]|uniref:LexA family protein n=1 Tax=Marinilactibacillus piezotolerans TaxID=258723 RepID=UPI0009B01DD8|nr:XRE family transcriptional regulator [Marinilactibacillus piezotolerans]